MTKRVSIADTRYAELHAASAFSFLDGASLPEDLAARAAELDLPAVALCDTDGVYGAPRFYKACKSVGVRPLVGAEISLDEPGRPRLTLLVESRHGYRNLCRLITAAAVGRSKGRSASSWELISSHSEGLHALSRDALHLSRLKDIFPGRFHIELNRHRLREQERLNRELLASKLPFLATNAVRYAAAKERPVYDALCCIRNKTTLDQAGKSLDMNRERHLKSPAEMSELFRDLPDAVSNARRLADRLEFTLDDLGYRFPDFPLPQGETPSSYLRKLVRERAPSRFNPLTEKARLQLEKELTVIEKLDLAGYFLILWDIIEFCRREKILVQGRGSAANSAVCYALGITAVDPVRMELLFERFLSEERGEWPDIDLDLPSGEQREKAIQYLYARYRGEGGSGVAMTANVITYRPKLAIREAAKVMGYSSEHVDRLAKAVGGLDPDDLKTGPGPALAAVKEKGFDPAEPRVRKTLALWKRLWNLPRHLGQHSGGMVLCRGRLDDVVPLEPAAMPGRTVVQWDKEDCADLGLIKVDMLGLGMLSVFEQALPIIERHEGKRVDLAHLPDDPLIYRMLQTADTVGLFQLESRAQMASLVKHRPERFYDIVVQVAIIRPGPIVGGMVRPFFERRRGAAKVEYPHPCLEPILKRTLGVPLFQEQILRMAMAAADFTGGEAEELRRAMGFKRSAERMAAIERRLREGMERKGMPAETRDQIVKLITSFALYGFPESHAASFALLAYASAYLKVRHPAAFYASLLNAWPMGFYHPATLIQDAKRRGVEVRPIDALRSGWDCRWEEGAVRLGLKFVKGLSAAAGRRVEAAAAAGAPGTSSLHSCVSSPIKDPRELATRAELSGKELDLLAWAGALGGFGLKRREALWQAARAGRPEGPLFEGAPPPEEASPLEVMSAREESAADYASAKVTAGPHLMAYRRAELTKLGVLSARELASVPDGRRVKAAGSAIVRQRPPTAKGFVFITLEDETGLIQAIVPPDLYQEHRAAVGAAWLAVEGPLQSEPGHLSVRAERLWPLTDLASVPSHDFH